MKRIISSILVFAMILTMVPAAFAASTDFELKMGEGSYTAEPGSTIAIPVYFTSASTATEKMGTFQTTIAVPDGFAFTVDGGVLSSKDISVSATQIKVLSEAEEDFANTDPLFTLNCTVPTTEGTYTLEFGSKTTKIKDRETEDSIDKAKITLTGATIEVKTTTPAPEEPSTDFELKMGEGAYTAEAGSTIAIPVYFISASTATEKMGTFQTTIAVPDGFAFTVDGGVLSGKDISVSATQIKVLSEAEEDFANTDPLFTLNCTVPSTAGTYTLEFGSKTTKIKDRETEDSIDKAKITLTGATITVTAGETPVAPTLTGITVNPTAVEVPYGADAKVTVEDAITGVTAAYSDGTTALVTGWEVEISGDGSKAIVKYNGAEAEIALTYAQPPVTDVEIVVAVTEIEVPYGTADVEAFVIAAVGEVKVEKSNGDVVPVEATVKYVAENSVVTVSYGELTPVQIPVKVITLVSYKLVEVEEPIEIPYDTANAEEYVAGKLSVKGILSDESEIDVADFTVTIEGEVATVKVGDTEVGTVAVKMGEAPVAAIVGIEIVPADAIVIPYGVEEIAEYIKSKIVVNTIDENDEKAATEAYELVADDGVATVSYGEFTDTVDYSLETATLTASVSSIEIPYTVAEADYAAYIAGRVTVAVDYSADTRDETITITADMIELDNGIALITAMDTEVPVEVPYTVQPAPEFFDDAVAAYGLEGKVLVKVTGVADGKVVVINGIYAKYFGNGKFAAVVDAEYSVTLEEVAAMPAAVVFGMLHPEGVTAWDALVTNDEALQKDVEVFDNDIQNYVLADFDGNGKIEAIDALNINKISLNNSEGTLPSWAE